MRKLIEQMDRVMGEGRKKRATMDADTHETVWGLGAEAARSGGKKFDLDGAFIAAVRKYGTKVFPAAKAREDDPWFDEFFQAFRDGAAAAGASVDEATGVLNVLTEAKIWATKGLLDFGWTPFSREVEIGLGGEWWAGELSPQAGKSVTFHHRKEKVDEAYKPVLVAWEFGKDATVVTITGGFLSEPATVELGVKKVVSE